MNGPMPDGGEIPGLPLEQPNLGRCWRFGNAEMDERSTCLRVNGREVSLYRSDYELLLCLVRSTGSTVDKGELLRVGWPGRIVTDNSLTKAIGRLRDALNDVEGKRILLVRTYGYRLTDVVEPIQATSLDAGNDGATQRLALSGPTVTAVVPIPSAPDAVSPGPGRPSLHRPSLRPYLFILIVVAFGLAAVPWLLPTPPDKAPSISSTPALPSIAVLPFTDLSPNHDQGYFADGLADELLTDLARLPQLKVVARTSSFAFRGKELDVRAVGKQLNAATVLEGSVVKSEERLRITLQLIDTATGYHLWSHIYERPTQELFAMQDDIAQEVLGALRIELKATQLKELTHHTTTSVEAYEEYLLAHLVYMDDETSHRRAITHLERAVELDPKFVDAWYWLADCLSFSGLYADSAEEALAGKRRAMEIAERIIALAPNDPKGYFMRGTRRYAHWWDWTGAEQDIERAHALGYPNNYYFVEKARISAAHGHLEEAIALEQRALQAEQLTGNTRIVMGYHYTALGDYTRARETLRQFLFMKPNDAHSNYYLGLGELLQGRAAAALPHFEDSAHELRLTGEAIAQYTLGDSPASERDLQLLISRYGHVLPYNVAEVYAWRGEHDKAFEWLDRAARLHDASLPMYLKFDPLVARIRDDARYGQLLRKLNLPQ